MPTNKGSGLERKIARGMAVAEVTKTVTDATVFLQVRLWLKGDPRKGSRGAVGVPYDPTPGKLDDDIIAGQAAVVRKFWQEAPALSLTAWIEQKAAALVVTPPTEAKPRDKRTGKSRLAAALLGLPYDATTRAAKPFKALLRSLQRAASPTKPGRKESHVTISSQAYIDLINVYSGKLGERSPFSPGVALSQLDRMAENLPNLAVLGDWWISNRFYRQRLLHTSSIVNYDPETMRRARAVVRQDGEDFCATVEYHISNATQTLVVLENVYLLGIQGGLPIGVSGPGTGGSSGPRKRTRKRKG